MMVSHVGQAFEPAFAHAGSTAGLKACPTYSSPFQQPAGTSGNPNQARFAAIKPD